MACRAWAVRVVIRAIQAFADGGGSWDDVDKLKITAIGHDFFPGVDPLGYMAESAEQVREALGHNEAED